MDKNNIKTNKLSKIILVTISILFFFYKTVVGYGEWDHLDNGRYLCNLSVFNTICGYTTYVPNQDGATGYHTIDYGDVNEHRAQLSGSFTISMSSNMVYCCDNARTTRRGEFDYTTYYVAEYVPGNNDWTTGTYADANNDAIAFIDEPNIFNSNNISGAFSGGIFRTANAQWEINNRLNESSASLFKEYVPADSLAPGFADAMLYYGRLGTPRISDYSGADYEGYSNVLLAAIYRAVEYAKSGMNYVFQQLAEDGKVDPIDGEADINGVGTYSQGSGDEAIGPMVTIMQEHNAQYPAATYAERGYVAYSNSFQTQEHMY